MYKLTVMDNSESIYDSVSNPLPKCEVYFHTHQTLWKDDIQIGRIYIDKKFAKLMLGTNKPINIPRDIFQELFMKDAQIVELIFHAVEVSKVQMFTKKVYQIIPKKNYKFVRLYKKESNTFSFYADLVYKLK